MARIKHRTPNILYLRARDVAERFMRNVWTIGLQPASTGRFRSAEIGKQMREQYNRLTRKERDHFDQNEMVWHLLLVLSTDKVKEISG